MSNPNSSVCSPPLSTLPSSTLPTLLTQLMMMAHFEASPQEVANAAREKESQLLGTRESPA
jgi:hypothetical protein